MTQERTDLQNQGPHLLASQVPHTLPALRQYPDPGESSLSREGSVPPSWGPGPSELQQEGWRPPNPQGWVGRAGNLGLREGG